MINTTQFTGTANYYRHWMGFRYTDGVKFIADSCKAYWLIDLIASWQPELVGRYGQSVKDFQVWKLRKKDDGAWIARCEDGNNGYLASQDIPMCDFPDDDGCEVWMQHGVMFLPSEY